VAGLSSQEIDDSGGVERRPVWVSTREAELYQATYIVQGLAACGPCRTLPLIEMVTVACQPSFCFRDRRRRLQGWDYMGLTQNCQQVEQPTGMLVWNAIGMCRPDSARQSGCVTVYQGFVNIGERKALFIQPLAESFGA
jgi:hypothetical protein